MEFSILINLEGKYKFPDSGLSGEIFHLFTDAYKVFQGLEPPFKRVRLSKSLEIDECLAHLVLRRQKHLNGVDNIINLTLP